MTLEEIHSRMDELAREYGRTRRGDPRRAEIAKELSELCRLLPSPAPSPIDGEDDDQDA